MKIFSILIAVFTILFSVTSANATGVYNNYGLSSPVTTINFDELGLDGVSTSNFTFDPSYVITDQYEADFGVVFDLKVLQSYDDADSFSDLPDLSGGFLSGTTADGFGNGDSGWNIRFTENQTAFATALFYDTSAQPNKPAIFEAYLDDVLIESFEVTVSSPNGGGPDRDEFNNYYGFTGITFNRVSMRLFSEGLMLDNMQLGTHDSAAAPVPEPTTFVLLGLGLAGLACTAAIRKRSNIKKSI